MRYKESIKIVSQWRKKEKEKKFPDSLIPYSKDEPHTLRYLIFTLCIDANL